MGKIACSIEVTAPNGKDSKLFDDLWHYFGKDREIAKIVYSTYIALRRINPTIFAKIPKDKNGEPTLRALTQQLNLVRVATESNNPYLISIIEKQYGTIDSSGNPITFNSVEEALNKAKEINGNKDFSNPDIEKTSVKAIVAHVESVKDGYQVKIEKANTKNLINVAKVTTIKNQYELLRNDLLQLFDVDIIDDSVLSHDVFDLLKLKSFNTHIANIIDIVTNYKTVKDLNAIPTKSYEVLLQLMQNKASQVGRLVKKFGSIEKAAEAIQQNKTNPFDTGTKNLIIAFINKAANIINTEEFQDFTTKLNHIEELNNENLDEISYITKTATEVVSELFKDNDVEIKKVKQLSEQVTNVEEAVQHGLFILNTLLKKLKAEERTATDNTIGKGLQLRIQIMQISTAIKAAENSLKEASNYNALLLVLKNITSIFEGFYRNIEQLEIESLKNSEPEQLSNVCHLLIEYHNLYEGCKQYLENLITLNPQKPDVVADENIPTDFIKQQSLKLLTQYLECQGKINKIKVTTLLNVFSNILSNTSDIAEVQSALNILDKNTAAWDLLYGIGESSDKLTAAIGSIIRKAEDKRTSIMNSFKQRISEAEAKLRASGINNTKWMYERVEWETLGKKKHYTYMIISDRDWGRYFQDRSVYISRLSDQLKVGMIDQLTFNDMLQEWEIAHTDEIIVDSTNERVERIPTIDSSKLLPHEQPYIKEISPLDYLTDAQIEYYETIMQIKAELGSLLPQFAQHQFKPVQKRRTTLDIFTENFGNKNKWTALKERCADIYTIREDDTEIAANGIITEFDDVIALGSSNLDDTPLNKIPIFYINSLKDQEELLMDFGGALNSFAGTAINYDCMKEIEDIVMFLSDNIKHRKVQQQKQKGNFSFAPLYSGVKIGGKTVIKPIKIEETLFNRGAILDAYIQAHLYGKTINPVKGLKLFRSLLKATSSLALTLNVKGATANFFVGEVQMLIEACGNEFYGISDLTWAHGMVLKENSVEAAARIMDYASGNVRSKAGLLREMFDPMNEQFRQASNHRYYSSLGKRLLSEDYTFKLYGIGEEILHALNMYALLHATKVYNDLGKEVSLYKALTVIGTDSNKSLSYKDYYYKNDKGEMVAIDDAFIQKIKRRLRYINQTTHGAMNQEDKGIISQFIVGRFVMNMRQWMVGHYSRRFRKRYWDARLEEEREGFHITYNRFLLAHFKKMIGREYDVSMMWSNLSEMEKANIRRARTEDLLFILLTLCNWQNFGFGAMDDIKNSYWQYFLLYQLKRLTMEVQGSTPFMGGVFVQGFAILNSPIAAVNLFKNWLYIGWGIANGDIFKTIQSGKNKGDNKYLNHVLQYSVPFYRQVNQTINLTDNNQLFRYLNAY